MCTYVCSHNFSGVASGRKVKEFRPRAPELTAPTLCAGCTISSVAISFSFSLFALTFYERLLRCIRPCHSQSVFVDAILYLQLIIDAAHSRIYAHVSVYPHLPHCIPTYSSSSTNAINPTQYLTVYAPHPSLSSQPAIEIAILFSDSRFVVIRSIRGPSLVPFPRRNISIHSCNLKTGYGQLASHSSEGLSSLLNMGGCQKRASNSGQQHHEELS